MFAKRPPLLLAFAGGCLSGAALILSGVGAVSLWRGGAPALSSPHGTGERNEDVVEAHVAAVPAGTRERRVAVAKTGIATEELEHEPAAAHASAEASAEHPSDSGSSVADVLTRLEAAYRQGLVDGARASESHAGPSPAADPTTGAAEPASAAGSHDVPAREESAATAVGNSPVVATAAPAAAPAPSQPAVIAVPAPPITVAVITPPADVGPAYPPQALGAGAAPAAATPEPAQAHDGTASVTQNIHIDNLHQGDVYQQLAVMQYMQLFAGSPYGGYAPAPAVPAHHHSTTTSSPFSTPALPVAAPPFPSFLTSLTNPANPYPMPQRHVGRAFR